MSDLQVVLELPEKIELGLTNGTLERIGGVIVERSSRNIVAWLRDSAHITEIVEPVGAFGLVAGTLSKLAGTGLLLNLAVSSATLFTTIQRLDNLSSAVDKLAKQQALDFKRDRDTTIKSALKIARDALEGRKSENRTNAAHQAIGKLYEAEDSLFIDFEQAITNDIVAAQHYLLRAMHVCTSRIRCHLELEEIELARNRLVENINVFQPHSARLVKKLLGKYPAVFLHKDFDREEVERFLAVQRWLHKTENDIDIIDALRAQFWKSAALEIKPASRTEAMLNKLPNIRTAKPVNIAKYRRSALESAEVVIENHRRLEGFELEIREMRLSVGSFKDWRDITGENLEDNNIAIIYDNERLAML